MFYNFIFFLRIFVKRQNITILQLLLFRALRWITLYVQTQSSLHTCTIVCQFLYFQTLCPFLLKLCCWPFNHVLFHLTHAKQIFCLVFPKTQQQQQQQSKTSVFVALWRSRFLQRDSASKRIACSIFRLRTFLGENLLHRVKTTIFNHWMFSEVKC